MQNSIAWIVSAILSVAAHYGLMAVAGQIPLPDPDQEQLAEVLLGNPTFQAVTLDAAAAAQGAAIQTSATLPESTSTADQEAAPVEATAAEPKQNEEIVQSAAPAESQAAVSAAELAPDNNGLTASQSRNEAEATIASPAATIATQSAPEVMQQSAPGPSAEPPPAAAPLAPAQNATATAPPAQGPVTTAAAPEPLAQAPTATEVAEASTGIAATTVEAAASEVSSAGGTQELAPEKPAAAAPIGAGTKMAAAITAPAPVMSQGDRVRSFMREYEGKGCIYAQASDADAARPSFKGLGGQSGAVEEFATAFRQAVGIDPELALRSVMDAQCPAVDFISAISGGERQNLEVVLDQDIVQDGGMLIGRLEGRVQGEIMLLLVDDDGAVRDITSEFHLLPAGNFFGVAVALQGEGRGRNQLVLALASIEPLGITVTRKPGEAATLFKNLAARIAADGLAVRTAYAAFRVQ